MPNRFAHILWDWNGTLFDDAAMAVDVVNGMLRLRGKSTIDAWRYQEEFGFPIRDYYERIGFDFSVEAFEDAAVEFVDEYAGRLAEVPLRAGTTDALRSLVEAGYSQSVLSATEQGLLEEMVRGAGVGGFFVGVSGLDNHYAASKIENGKRLIAELGCEPRRVLMVGDTVHDYEVARAMGTQCLLIPSGHQSRARLEGCGARVVEELEEVVGFVGGAGG